MELEPRIRQMNQTAGCLADTPDQTNESDNSTRQPGVWQTIVRRIFSSDSDFGCSGNDLFPNQILAFAKPKWTKMVHFGPFWPQEVHFGPFRSANRTLAIPERKEIGP